MASIANRFAVVHSQIAAVPAKALLSPRYSCLSLLEWKMSFKNQRFVVGSSEDERSVSSAASSVSAADADIFRVNEQEVDDIVLSCTKSIVSRNALQDVRKNVLPTSTLSSLSVQRSISPALASSTGLTSSSDDGAKRQKSAIETDASVADRGRSDKVETDMERLLRLRAQRFNLYNTAESVIGGSNRPTETVKRNSTLEPVPKAYENLSILNSSERNVPVISDITAPLTSQVTVAATESPVARVTASEAPVVSTEHGPTLGDHTVSAAHFGPRFSPSFVMVDSGLSSKNGISPTNAGVHAQPITSISSGKGGEGSNGAPPPGDSQGPHKRCLKCFTAGKAAAVVFSHDDNECPFSSTTSIQADIIDIAEATTNTSTPSLKAASESATSTTGQLRKVQIGINPNSIPVLPNSITQKLVTILRKGDYNAKLTETMLSEAMNVLGRTYANNVSEEILVTMRGSVLADRAMMVHPRLSQKDIATRYERGESIVAIANHIGAPAFACFRCVLKERGCAPRFITDVVQGNVELDNPRDRREREAALLVDTTTIEVPDKFPSAMEFEERVAQILRAKGIPFASQQDLQARGGITPDFLIEDKMVELSVGQHGVQWIDAKNFFGGISAIQIKRLKKQAMKYVEAFGPGALLFSMGFSEQLRKDLPAEIILIDYRWITAMADASTGSSQVASIPSKSTAFIAPAVPLVPLSSSSPPVVSANQAPAKRARIMTTHDAWEHILSRVLPAGGYFGDVTDEMVREVNDSLRQGDPDAEPYTKQQLEMIRRDLLSEMAAKIERQSIPHESQLIIEVAQAFLGGKSVRQLSDTHNLPPLMVMRMVIEGRGGSTKKQAKAATRQDITAAGLKSLVGNQSINKKEFEEIQNILERDLTYSPVSEGDFQMNVVNFLQSVGVEVQQLQMAEQPYLIPKTSLTIEGRDVKWVVTYNHLCGVSPSSLSRLNEMSSRLVKTYGPGALIFSLGFTDPNALSKLKDEVVLVDFRLLNVAQNS